MKAFNGLVDEIGGVSDDNQFLPLSYLSQVVDEFHIRGRQSSLLLSRVKVGASLQPGHGLCIRQDDFVRWLSVPIIAPPPTLAGNEDVSPPPDTVSQLPQDPRHQSARALEQYFSLLGPTDSETPPAALAGHSTHQATATLARLTASALAARAVVDAAAEKERLSEQTSTRRVVSGKPSEDVATVRAVAGHAYSLSADSTVQNGAADAPATFARTGVLLTTGAWYYEVWVATPGRFLVGWGTDQFVGTRGVGVEARSCALASFASQVGDCGEPDATAKTLVGDVSSGALLHLPPSVLSHPLLQLQAGDVVGCSVQLCDHAGDASVPITDAPPLQAGECCAECRFSVNGQWLKQSGRIIWRSENGCGVTPLVTVLDDTCRVRFLLGQHNCHAYKVPGFPSVWRSLGPPLLQQVIAEAKHHYGAMVPTSGMATVTIDNETGLVRSTKRGFPSVVLTSVALQSGRWYYEVTVVKPGIGQVRATPVWLSSWVVVTLFVCVTVLPDRLGGLAVHGCVLQWHRCRR